VKNSMTPSAETDIRALSESVARILTHPDPGRVIELVDSPSRGLFGFNSRDRRSRPFNLLRSQILKISRNKNFRIIGVTSATPQVGKTFTSSNLATALSRIPGLRVLLIDLDLRRGSIAEAFGIEVEVGIQSYLSGETDVLDTATYHIENTGLTILPCTPTMESSAEILAGPRLGQLVSALRQLPEDLICICDLPPAFANDDTAIALRELDAYIFVVEEGRTTANQVRDSIDLLLPSPCVGTVLNKYKGGIGGDNYGFGYGTSRYYDEYYS